MLRGGGRPHGDQASSALLRLSLTSVAEHAHAQPGAPWVRMHRGASFPVSLPHTPCACRRLSLFGGFQNATDEHPYALGSYLLEELNK